MNHTPENFTQLFRESCKPFDLIFAGYRIILPQEWKNREVDALYFGQTVSIEMSEHFKIFW